MYTLKFLGLTSLLLILFVLGAILRSGDLLSLCLPLLFYFFFAMQGEEPETAIERARLPERGMAGSILPVSFTISVENPANFMEVFDRAKGVVENNYFLLPGDSQSECSYHVKLRRGVLEIGPVVVRHYNFLRTQFWEHSLETKDTVVVIPKIHDLKPLQLRPRHTRVFYGMLPSRKAGIGEEFFALRDYYPGDEYRKINWKASSRYGQLVTNEYEAMKTTDVVIVLDARRENALGEEKILLDYSLDAAASISAAVLKGGNRLGFLAYSDSFYWLYPSTTRRHLLKILEILTDIQPKGSFRLDYIKNLISAFFTRGSQLVLISPLLDPSSLMGIQGLYALGFDILVVSPSPITFQWSHCDQDIYHELARRVLERERALLCSQLQEYATVVDWNIEQPLGKPLSEVRLFRPRR